MKAFEFTCPAKIVFGPGRLVEIGELVSDWGAKAMIVCDAFGVSSGVADRTADSLKSAGIETVIFDKVLPNPTCTLIDEGAHLAIGQKIDFVIGLGGGSSMDTAKGVAVAATHGGNVWPYANGDKAISAKTLPVAAVSTTSGTGSQCTCFSVISNPDTNQKPGMGSPYILPKLALIDPELMLSVPPALTAVTGFDVFTHALEAYTSNICTDMSDIFARRALELLVEALPRAYRDGKDLDARAKLALADTYAGIAICHAVVSLGHVMAHVIGGHFPDIAHGDALFSIYPELLKLNHTGMKEKHRFVASLLDCGSKDIVSAFGKFFSAFEFRNELKRKQLSEKLIKVLAQDTFTYMEYATKFNPVECTVADAEKILRNSLK